MDHHLRFGLCILHDADYGAEHVPYSGAVKKTDAPHVWWEMDFYDGHTSIFAPVYAVNGSHRVAPSLRGCEKKKKTWPQCRSKMGRQLVLVKSMRSKRHEK